MVCNPECDIQILWGYKYKVNQIMLLKKVLMKKIERVYFTAEGLHTSLDSLVRVNVSFK